MLDVKFKLRPGHTSERSWMEPSPLRQLFWNVTYSCNYRCSVCFSDAGRPAPDELTTREATQLVQRAHEAGVKDIVISGGEPFARPDIVQVLSRMAEVGLTARVASNGSLLEDDLLVQLRRRTTVKSFQISVDTLDPDLYCEIHGAPSGALERVLGVLGRIKEHGFHTTVSARLTPRTLPGIPALLERAQEEGWATVTVHWPVHTRRVHGAFPQDADFLSLLVPTFERFLQLPDHWLVETYIPWAQYHPVMQGLEGRTRVVHRGCRAGRDRLTVNPTGWLTPCVCMDVPPARVGNVREDSLTTVFQESSICDMLRRPWAYEICAECPRLEVCGAGCRASALVLTGRLDGQDRSCPVWQRGSKATV
ncbi:MAG: radical SAM protein [Candidatus Brocadiia bacterium]